MHFARTQMCSLSYTTNTVIQSVLHLSAGRRLIIHVLHGARIHPRRVAFFARRRENAERC